MLKDMVEAEVQEIEWTLTGMVLEDGGSVCIQPYNRDTLLLSSSDVNGQEVDALIDLKDIERERTVGQKELATMRAAAQVLNRLLAGYDHSATAAHKATVAVA